MKRWNYSPNYNNKKKCSSFFFFIKGGGRNDPWRVVKDAGSWHTERKSPPNEKKQKKISSSHRVFSWKIYFFSPPAHWWTRHTRKTSFSSSSSSILFENDETHLTWKWSHHLTLASSLWCLSHFFMSDPSHRRVTDQTSSSIFYSYRFLTYFPYVIS